jgi:hypothetical protein
MVIGGDFNVNILKHSPELDELELWSLDSGLQQVVDGITRRILQSELEYLFTYKSKPMKWRHLKK